jgi:GntR family transcriptional repressor for pyruvate dehydrogenase complex
MQIPEEHRGLLEIPLANRSLVDRIIDRITEALIRNELVPGDRLPTENDLVATFGVGKSSVREAIKILQAMGVVEVRRGDGTFVARSAPAMGINPMLYQLLLDQGSIQDIFDLREVFEPGYTVLALRNATSTDIKNIERELRRFEKLVETNSQTGEDDLCFHLAILEATHNPYVIRVGSTILKLFMGSVSRSVRNVPRQAVDDHNRIFEALRDRDESALYKAVLNSFLGWKQNQSEKM